MYAVGTNTYLNFKQNAISAEEAVIIRASALARGKLEMQISFHKLLI